MPDGGMVNPVDSYKPDRFFVDGQDKAVGFAQHLMAGAGRVEAEGTPHADGQADVFEVTGIDRANRGAVG